MIAFPFAKINIGLRVAGRRTDGYHDIETCFLPLPWTDVLEIIRSDTPSFRVTGLPIDGDPASNLCLKARDLLATIRPLPPLAIHLHKVIPLGAGLGGGSSDATHTLRLLNTLLDLQLDEPEMQHLTTGLGSDCRFFLEDRPAMGTGRGDILTPIDLRLNEYTAVIVMPALRIATAEAYRWVQPRTPDHPLNEILGKFPVAQWKEHVVNDFEEPVIRRFPQIGELKEQLYRMGAVFAAMTGSGSALFGLFRTPVDVRRAFPTCLTWSGRLG